MGFWSTMAKIGGDVAGSFIGDPMLGNQLTDLSQMFGGEEEGRASGRAAAGDLILKRGQLANSMYSAALNARALEGKLDSDNYSQAQKGLLAANMQDVGVETSPFVKSHLTTFTGGLRPSAIGPEGRALGANMARFASSRIGRENMPTAPTLPDLPEANWLDTLLSGAQAGTGILGILKKKGGASAGKAPSWTDWQPQESD